MSYKDQVLADGAVAYWRFEEASGLTIADEKGTRPLTLPATGITYGVAGALADASKGIATDAAVTAASFATINLAPGCAIEFWFKPTAGAAAYMSVIQNIAGGGGVYFNSITRKVNFYTGADNFNTTALTPGTRYHVVVSVDGASLGTFYLNGVADGTATGFTTATPNALFNGTGGGPLVATLFDELSVYQTALTPAKIAAHYQAGINAARRRRPMVLGDDTMLKYNVATPVTPSDTVDLARTTEAIYVGSDGNVAVVLSNNVPQTFVALAAGSILPIAARRVNAAGTTSTGLLALYTS